MSRLQNPIGIYLVSGILCACGGGATSTGDAWPVTDQQLADGREAGAQTDGPRPDVLVEPDQGPVMCGGVDCNDGLACTTDTCENNTCVNTTNTGFCLIDGACYADADKKDPTGCAVCDSKTTSSTWSDMDTACPDDGQSCTTAKCSAGTCSQELQAGFCFAADHCIADGKANPQNDCEVCDVSVSTSALQNKPDGTACASDNLSCTTDQCSSGSCSHPVASNSCLVGGVCYVAGEVNPLADCQGCDPTLSQTGWSQRPDGSACTDDNLTCTTDVCAGGFCSHPAKAGTCFISGVCYAAGNTNPVAECTHCDPSNSSTTWTDKPSGVACTSDGLACTEDVCGGGSCVHPVAPGSCFIGGLCYAPLEKHPTIDCQGCDPTASATTWSILPNGTACSPDVLSCTDDVCTQGACTHPLKDAHCLIGGQCYADDDVVSSPCTVCAPTVNTSSGTFAAGRPCDDGSTSTGVDTCIAGSCRGFVANTWEWLSTDTNTSINGVASVPGSGVWAVGSFEDSGGEDGFIAHLNGPSVAPSNLSWDEHAFHGVHDRMAVGDAGQCRYYNGASWLTPASVESFIGATNLHGVWGFSPGGIERTLFLAGDGARMARCHTSNNGSTFACSNHTGVVGNMKRVFGTVSGSTQGPLWALRNDSWEDIYYNPGSGTSWSTTAPQGCFDATANPCGDTSGRFIDLWAVSSSEIWATGEAGLLMRKDANGWVKVVVPSLTSPPQSGYIFRGVYTSPGSELVVVVGDREFGGQWHDMIVLFYNRTLDRWYSPRIAFYTPLTDTMKDSYRFNDVGGETMTGVYLVGSLPVGGEQRALFMTLQ